MSREDYVAVAVRLFAVFLFLWALWMGLGALLRAGQGTGFPAAALAVVLPILGVAALFWFFPLTIARKLLPVMREPAPALRAPAHEVEAVAFTVVGLWLLANAMADAAYWLIFLAATMRSEYADASYGADNVAGMITTVVELAIAVALLLGTRGLQRALHRLRGRPVAD